MIDLNKRRNKMENQTKINKAINEFRHYILLGWETELSFNIAYDSIYDIIAEEDFLNLCQKAIS